MKYCEMQLTAWESTIIDRQFSRLSFSNSSQIVYFFHSNLLICQKCRILGFFLSLFFVWILKRRAEKELKIWNIREWFSSFHHLFTLLQLFFPKSGVFDNPVFLTRVEIASNFLIVKFYQGDDFTYADVGKNQGETPWYSLVSLLPGKTYLLII